LWDDELTENEMDLICGVYHVPGKQTNLYQVFELTVSFSQSNKHYSSFMVAKGINLGAFSTKCWLVDTIM
jgi:hypothetical protein